MTTPGQKIIKGLQEATRGDFAAVTIDGQRWVRSDAFEAMVEALEDGRVIVALMRVQQQLDDHIFERENEILRDEEPYPFDDALTVGVGDLLPVSRVIRAALALARGERS